MTEWSYQEFRCLPINLELFVINSRNEKIDIWLKEQSTKLHLHVFELYLGNRSICI